MWVSAAACHPAQRSGTQMSNGAAIDANVLPRDESPLTDTVVSPPTSPTALSDKRVVARGPANRVIGQSVQGRPITCQTHGHGPDTILIIATIHGDESAGTPLLGCLAEHLQTDAELLEGRRVLLVPIANPDGLDARRRHNARGVDLNRNFPADNFTRRRQHGTSPLSEPESAALQELIANEQPARIISLHEPLSCVDYDGPAADLAQHIAAAGRLSVRKLGSRPGSLGAYAGGTLNVPIITLELPKRAARLEFNTLWERFGPMLLAAITYR
jgi:protein MpaA